MSSKFQFWDFQVLWWKFTFMSFSKPQVKIFFKFCITFQCHERYICTFLGQTLNKLCTKGTNQSGHFENFECSGQNSPNSCHFWNNKSVFLQILHHSSVSWDITPLYFFSWNFIYFQQKESIKVQIWWNFTWAVKSLKFCTLMGSFGPNHVQFQLKKYRRVISHDTEEWCKV